MTTIDPANPAPGRLELVRRFVNTADRYGGHDQLADPRDASRWLADKKLMRPESTVSPSALSELHQLRETLRDLAAANRDGEPLPAETLAAFNRAVAAHPSAVVLKADEHGELQSSLIPQQTGVAGVAAYLSAAVHEALVAGTWPRLKSCANPDCTWLFFDTSRSRTGRWCSMKACGSIHKARAYRRRQAAR